MNQQRMTTNEVLDAIARERQRLWASVDALGAEAATIPVTDEGWTAKDVLAHLIHWLGQVAFGLGAQLQPPAYVTAVAGRPGGDEWNALAVEHYRDVPLDEVRAEFERLVDALVVRARLRTDDEINGTDAIAWAPGRPLWDFIGGDTFLHWPLHSDAIERAGRSATSS
ncbi:MAG: maleylpyruvate isomerase N-terminal domain-containing protein [Dehalococcoidia bacterium]